MHRIFFKSIDIRCGFSPWHIISITCLHINCANASFTRKRVYTNLIGVSYVECLVCNSTTNQNLNKTCNGCLYMVLDWPDIFVIVCGAWYNLSKISMIVFSEPASYLQFSCLDIIVSHVVDSNLVLHHHYSYIVHM